MGPGQLTDVALPDQALQIGDVVDFVVGVNGTLGGDSTAVSAAVVPVVNAPASFQALAMPGGATTIVLAFSKPVTAQAAGFLLSGGASVLSVTTGLASNVLVLTTTPLTQGASYTLTMNGVTDLQGDPVSPGLTTNFVALDYTRADVGLVRPPAEPPGPATRRGGLAISEIHDHPALRSDGRVPRVLWRSSTRFPEPKPHRLPHHWAGELVFPLAPRFPRKVTWWWRRRRGTCKRCTGSARWGPMAGGSPMAAAPCGCATRPTACASMSRP